MTETPTSTGATRKPSRLPVALPVTVWAVAVLAGVGCLVAAMIPVGPDVLGSIGAVTISTTFTAALAGRAGGQPYVFGLLALLIGVGVQFADDAALRTGAAVLTCTVSAVLGVMITVPARRFLLAARECLVAVLVGVIGAMATVGYEPQLSLVRFEYVTLGLAFVGILILVHRLGAGLHGLGRRGVAIVVVGTVLLAVALAYAELLRRYGATDVVETLLDGVRWSREHLGAFPRPIEAVLGIPAIAWGCHMRARRRQGWWVCAFGVAATVPTANVLVNASLDLTEAALAVGYGLVVGLVIGYAVIRLDLALTGARGRGARRAEEAAALRPEPSRTSPLW